MAKCKSCGAPIIWVGMQSGKSMPCDAQQVVYWQSKTGESTIITPNGETIKATIEAQRTPATGVGFIPHWATCPCAANFKKRGRDNGRKQD